MRKLLLAAALSATAMSPIAATAGAGDFIIRARVIGVLPNDDAGGILPALPEGSVEVDNSYVPELDFTYFFTDRIAAELILATSPHTVSGTGAVEGLGDIADVWVLPPTLTVQYHFRPDASIRPYAGVGLNYTIFFNEDTSNSLNEALGETSIKLDDSLGFALQGGVDVDITENWFLNFDLKYIQIESQALLRTGNDANRVDVDINPFVVGFGVGRKF